MEDLTHMPPTQPMIRPPEFSRHFLNAKFEYFTDVQLWPLRTKLDPEAWLSNFSDAEEEYALHLLSAFLYFSDALTVQLLEATFQSLSLQPMFQRAPFLKVQGQWRAFLDSVLVTHITGETPNSTDSGHVFLRLVRQHLGIPQAHIMSPIEAATVLLAHGPRPVVLVDDFVGSGRQCIATWTRRLTLSNGHNVSFDRLASVHGTSFFYCPLVCTERGHKRIIVSCPGLTVVCSHLIGDRYSAFSPNSVVWPEHLSSGGEAFIQSASGRAGIPAPQWRGYADLGLTLAFAHCVPDATLPLFYWNANGWKPLIKRT